MTEQLTFEEALERHGIFLFTNVGRSMMPLIRQHRDLIEITKKGAERCKKYDVVLYKRDGKYILHRILKVREQDYVISGDHNYRKEYGITDKQIIGVLTAVVRDGNRIEPSDKKYRCYVHLWCDFFPIRAAILYGIALLRRLKHKLHPYKTPIPQKRG